MKKPKLGATGEFPKGKINDTDEGALQLAVVYDPDTDAVFVDFGTPVIWLALPRDSAIAFANALIKAAMTKGEST